LAFVFQAYIQGAGITPVPSVSGNNVTALQEWQCYTGQRPGQFSLNGVACPSTNQIKTSWQHTNSLKQVVTDAAPPRGAWVFYPSLTSQGHIAISIGGGKVIDPGEVKVNGCYVHVATYNAVGGSSSYFRGWAFPYNASH
jgi:hypothetical protein